MPRRRTCLRKCASLLASTEASAPAPQAASGGTLSLAGPYCARAVRRSGKVVAVTFPPRMLPPARMICPTSYMVAGDAAMAVKVSKETSCMYCSSLGWIGPGAVSTRASMPASTGGGGRKPISYRLALVL